MGIKERIKSIEKSFEKVRHNVPDPEHRRKEHHKEIALDLWISGEYELLEKHLQEDPKFYKLLLSYDEVIEELIMKEREYCLD